ncbi:MAG: glycosyltransferase family 2 protein [Hyphomicrobiales bacterium]|nr:glycosyltransferase family 2 protein [Hyphomicrobiales bacterium]MBV8825564.1 glycosyltransferase family 2 protein [Hyphomicrobiales bacterium]MBV9430115.1 glycosyltransferase family 2 protein [Bradyrhizobiaceae bacterium]
MNIARFGPDMSEQIELSIVTSLYKSSRYIPNFYSQACRLADKLNLPVEIIFVNDGSPDDSLDLAIDIHRRDPRVKVIDLSRNFGHHRALMTGFAYASGKLIYVTDADLEESMDFLAICYDRIKKGDCDVVYGYQIHRKGQFFERITGGLFWWLFNFLSSLKLPRNLVIARLMTRRYMLSLLQHRESDPFIAGLWTLTGYVQVGCPIVKTSVGTTSYSLRKRLSQTITSISSFSARPLLLAAIVGSGICAIAFVLVAYLVARWLLFGNTVEGWTSVMISVWIIGGVNLFFIGLVGLYISKIFTQVKQRPTAIVRAVYGNIPAAADPERLRLSSTDNGPIATTS